MYLSFPKIDIMTVIRIRKWEPIAPTFSFAHVLCSTDVIF